MTQRQRVKDRWEQMVRAMTLEESRDAQRQVLKYLDIDAIEDKLPEATMEQNRCWHAKTFKRGNQYGATVICKACEMKLEYRPTTTAAEAAAERKSRGSSKKKAPMTRPEAREALQRQEEQRQMRAMYEGVPRDAGTALGTARTMTRIEEGFDGGHGMEHFKGKGYGGCGKGNGKHFKGSGKGHGTCVKGSDKGRGKGHGKSREEIDDQYEQLLYRFRTRAEYERLPVSERPTGWWGVF